MPTLTLDTIPKLYFNHPTMIPEPDGLRAIANMKEPLKPGGYFRKFYGGRVLHENIIVAIILLAGFVLRIRQYLTGRSLWLDEAMLSLNIVNRNWEELFRPLDYDQGAPIGFLLVEKIFNLLLGRNEFALRLFPLLVGLVSLWMFYILLKHFTGGSGLLIPFALFALNPRLIYYSSEVKQYIMDVAVTVALLLFAAWLFGRLSRKGLGVLSLAGILALWFSHPSLFVLSGIGVALFFSCLQKRDFAELRLVSGMGILWLANVGLLYFLTLGNLRGNAYMHEYWQDAFAPMPPWADWNWYLTGFAKNMDTHFAITHAPWVVFAMMLAGWIILLRHNRPSGIMLAGILFSTLLASSLELYPSLERMTLFLIPIGLLLIGKALTTIHQRLRAYPIVSIPVLLTVCAFLFYGALPRTFEQFASPKYFEHIRPTMEYLQATWQTGDEIFLSNGAVPAFEYYAPMYGLEYAPYTSGRRDDYENPDTILDRLEPLKSKRRLWILMSHVYEKGDFNEKDFLLDNLDQIGQRRREFREPGTSVYLYLYDLSSGK
jgi:hypothetical protein